MKNLVLVSIFIALSFSVFSGTPLSDYVETESGVTYYDKVRQGFLSYLTARNDAGEKIVFNREDILSYRIDGKTFVKICKIINCKKYKEKVFMQKIAYKNDATVYAYTHYISSGEQVTDLYVFKNNDYLMTFNDNNSDYLIKFFNQK